MLPSLGEGAGNHEGVAGWLVVARHDRDKLGSLVACDSEALDIRLPADRLNHVGVSLVSSSSETIDAWVKLSAARMNATHPSRSPVLVRLGMD